MVTATRVASTPATKRTIDDTSAPKISCENTSWPFPVVPSRWAALGLWYGVKVVAVGGVRRDQRRGPATG